VLRKRAVNQGKKNLMLEFAGWFQNQLSRVAQIDWLAGMECIYRAESSTFWEWKDGLRFETILLAMAWGVYQSHMRWTAIMDKRWNATVESPPAKWTQSRTKRVYQDETGHHQDNGGISLLAQLSLSPHTLQYPKRKSDIKLIYDGTKSGLNGCFWAPWLPLPTIKTHLC